MSSLHQIRESLASLKAYELPERYEPVPNTSNEHDKENCSAQPLLDPETIQRYRSARTKYLRSSITNLLVEHLNTLRYDAEDKNCTKPMIEFPESITEERRMELKISMEAGKENLCRSVSEVKQSYENVYHKNQILQRKRKELENIVRDMEMKGSDRVAEMDVDGGNNGTLGIDDDKNLVQSEIEFQDEKMKSLLVKRSLLEAKLRKIRMETEHVSSQISTKKNLLHQMKNLNNPESDGGSSPDHVLDNAHFNKDAIEAETHQIRIQTQQFRDKSEFYESVRFVTEKISGIKIVSISDVEPDEDKMEISISPRKTSPLGRLESAITLKVQLLDEHIVEITLGNNGRQLASSTGVRSEPVDCFRVISAKFVTSTVLSDTLSREEGFETNSTPTVSISIPPLDDLVSLAANLESVQDLRFVLRETLARIRILSSRVNELAALRKKYLTKITNPAKNKVNYGFGGEDQEVLCSLESQVTVVLRLTADCPILKGSVYIQKIVGCGGWEDAVLQRIKSKINEMRFNIPVDLMDTVVEEIARSVKEDGLKIPKTPVLPRRK